MSEKPVVQVESLGKKYCRDLKRSFYYGAKDILNELSGRNSDELRAGEFWALRNVNFELGAGQALGLIGANGSGKTTLLKMLSGLIKPNQGSIRIRGRIAPLIALGAGFKPVLTGRENVFMNLSLLGVDKKDLPRKFKEVVDFAELWDAIDSPLRTYSSGMAARLGFACAIHTDPDVIFVDEVLAVGDARFRTKCYQRLANLRTQGTSLILVTHSASAILAACENSLYLQKGRMMFLGSSQEALRMYQHDQSELDASMNVAQQSSNTPTRAHQDFQITSVAFDNGDEKMSDVVHSGRPTSLVIKFRSQRPYQKLSVNVIVREQSLNANDVLSVSSSIDGFTFAQGAGVGCVRMNMDQCGLRPGRFVAKISVVEGDHYNILDIIESYRFRCEADSTFGNSSYFQPRSWSQELNPSQDAVI